MRIYKPTYRGRAGQVCESAKFYCELRTADGRVLRLPGFTNQRLTEALGRNVQRLIDCRASGEALPHQSSIALDGWSLPESGPSGAKMKKSRCPCGKAAIIKVN